MVPNDEPIYGISGEQVSTRGYIDLYTVFHDGTQTKTILIRFLIVDAPTFYNVLLGRHSLNTLGAVVSTPHLAMKFPYPSGDILTVHCDQRLAREWYMASLRPQLPIQQTNHIERSPGSGIALSGEDLDPRMGRDVRLEPVEETSPLELPNGHSINLGTGLNSDKRAIITPILVSNTNLFACSTADLPGVDHLVASHKLSIYKEARYISHKKCKLGEERRLAAKAEADKLLSVALINEAQYTTWQSNVVLVKKANGTKTTLTSPPILHKLDTHQPLLVYITATNHTVSVALVQEIEGTQHPVYFVSRTLQDLETRYQMVEKLALSLVHAARRLRPYFQNHSITVKTDYPIKKILQKLDLAERMSSWAVELSEFNIRYEPHGPIKAQCLLDFVNDLQHTPTED